MKRRDFIRKAGIATAGAFAAPYILPSGRLFAATGMRKVDHVVFCLYAGGVRNIETIEMNLGNLLPNMLTGTKPIQADIGSKITPLSPKPLSYTLQTKGALFKNFKYKFGPTGHFNGHTTAVTGQYTSTDLNIKDHPLTPTIFEFYRKHNSLQQTALKCWWVSNQLGPYPALNFSKYAGYGAQYGANFISPNFLFNKQSHDAIGNTLNFTGSEETCMNNIRNFVNNNFKHKFLDGDAGVSNTKDDTLRLKNWITGFLDKYDNGSPLPDEWPIGFSKMNSDMVNIYFAEQIIKEFTPELLVVNMQGVDVCHFNFTDYCKNLYNADYAVAHLWSVIQSTPGMMDNTVMIVAPEHGRNEKGNSNIDSLGYAAIDHTANIDGVTGDQRARDIFCLIVGPNGVVKQNVVSNQFSESIEIVPTIANLLGFDSAIPGNLMKSYNSCGLQDAFL